MYVCVCNGITDREVRDQAQRPGCTVAMIYRGLDKSPSCGKCAPLMLEILRETVELGRSEAD
jgi:bacterioferritin-associated ferredoxin